jgi:hypothetical protein
LTAAQAGKVIAEMVAISSGETMSFYTVETWLANKGGGTPNATVLRYRQVIRANLRWESVSLDTGLLRIETEKTGTVVVLPMYSDFAQWLAGRPREIGEASVFPELARKRVSWR